MAIRTAKLITGAISLFLVACGQKESSGFLTDNNYCAPAAPESAFDETIAGENLLAIPGSRNQGQSTLGQRTETPAKDTDVWGLQLRLAKKGAPTGTVTVEIWQEVKEGDILFDSLSKKTTPDGVFAVFAQSVKITPATVSSDSLQWVTFELGQVQTLIKGYNQWLLFNPPYNEAEANAYNIGSLTGSKSANYVFDESRWVVSEQTKLAARWIPCQ